MLCAQYYPIWRLQNIGGDRNRFQIIIDWYGTQSKISIEFMAAFSCSNDF